MMCNKQRVTGIVNREQMVSLTVVRGVVTASRKRTTHESLY